MQDPRYMQPKKRPEYAPSLSPPAPEQVGWVALTPARVHGAVHRMRRPNFPSTPCSLEWIGDAPPTLPAHTRLSHPLARNLSTNGTITAQKGGTAPSSRCSAPPISFPPKQYPTKPASTRPKANPMERRSMSPPRVLHGGVPPLKTFAHSAHTHTNEHAHPNQMER